MSADQACVGFADCGCPRCRASRRQASDGHNAGADHDAAYCEACRRAARS